MIQANELRIGNFIESIHNTNIELFTEVDLLLFVGIENEKFGFDDLQPIPLTEEWLLRFGFIKSSLHYFKKKGIIVQKEDDGCFECFLGSSIPILLHVHQLQNLYFALTGEELTLKT